MSSSWHNSVFHGIFCIRARWSWFSQETCAKSSNDLSTTLPFAPLVTPSSNSLLIPSWFKPRIPFYAKQITRSWGNRLDSLWNLVILLIKKYTLSNWSPCRQSCFRNDWNVILFVFCIFYTEIFVVVTLLTPSLGELGLWEPLRKGGMDGHFPG